MVEELTQKQGGEGGGEEGKKTQNDTTKLETQSLK